MRHARPVDEELARDAAAFRQVLPQGSTRSSLACESFPSRLTL